MVTINAMRKAKRRVIFRVDGNSQIGLGHIVRCFSLAQMLQSDFDLLFVVVDPEKHVREMFIQEGFQLHVLSSGHQDIEKERPQWLLADDILVVDGYDFTEAWVSSVRKNCHKLVVIDDYARIKYSTDVLINHNLYAKNLSLDINSDAQLCLGPEYALLRRPFWRTSSIRPMNIGDERLLLCFGGTDSKNMTLKVLKMLEASARAWSITAVIGASNKHLESLKVWQGQTKKKLQLKFDVDAENLINLIKETNVVIAAAGVMALELMAVKVPLILGHSVENQRLSAEEIHRCGAGLNLGQWDKVSDNDLLQNLEKLIQSSVLRHSLLEAQARLLDGQSGKRLLEVFKTLS